MSIEHTRKVIEAWRNVFETTRTAINDLPPPQSLIPVPEKCHSA
ncbi:MAG: hypothetical protein HZA09_05180 [Nitrospirae bacterium]|nr:hypothetical protein [Nitrospirota bacterium]